MSDTNGFAISVKEYAAQRGKTVQAVYQQMKRPENASRLKDHIIMRWVGNKHVKFLDEKAVTFLDDASNSAPMVVVGEEVKRELAAANDTIEQLKAAALIKQGEVNALKELLREKEQELRALAEPQSQIDALKAQNDVLSAERDQEREKATRETERAQKAEDELVTIKGKWYYKWFAKKG